MWMWTSHRFDPPQVGPPVVSTIVAPVPVMRSVSIPGHVAGYPVKPDQRWSPSVSNLASVASAVRASVGFPVC